MKPTVLIALCCHNHFSIVPPFCIPIQGGAKLNAPIPGAFPDIGPKGDISAKNHTYCELTVLYYVWKNQQADYYGICHYRRFFCFDGSVSRKYIARKTIQQRQQQRYFRSEREIQKLLDGCDVLVPYPEDMGMTVAEHYCSSRGHREQDLALFVTVVEELYPWLSEATETYLAQQKHYFCNMFLMKDVYFQEYCPLLFSILAEFDRRKGARGEAVADRTDGYLGERFLGIYLTFLRKQGSRIQETTRIDLECSLTKRVLYVLFPPESKRRFRAKKIWKRLQGRLRPAESAESQR